MVHLSTATRLDAATIADIEALVADATDERGASPLGEHKHAQLRPAAADWSGVFARRDGRLVGYAHVRWDPTTDVAADVAPRAAVEVVVDADHAEGRAGNDGRLDERLFDAARELVAATGGGRVWLWAHGVTDPARTLGARRGDTLLRELLVMTASLAVAPPVPPPPEDVRIARYQAERDDSALLAVNNAAFAGHPEQGGWGERELRDRRQRDWFDPEGLLLVWAEVVEDDPDDPRVREGERLLGFHWTKEHRDTSNGPEGEVYVLAVDPDAQGRGLGRLLLRAGLAHLHDRGCRRALLYVDAADTAAVDLYAAEGFTIAHREQCYETVVPARS